MTEAFPDLREPAGPPPEPSVEMAPFVTLDRWTHATEDDLARFPLVISTPRCAFRLEHLLDVFSGAEVRVVHLTRNPAASINGLVDGWLHRGFANCPTPLPLQIGGYSDVVPGGDRWWCFDFAPGWERYADRPLGEVCAFQWRATHEAALTAIGRSGVDHIRVRFEDLVAAGEVGARTVDRIEGWTGVSTGALASVVDDGLPVKMATRPPSPGRWRQRRDVIEPLTQEPEVAAMAEELDYGSDRHAWT